jgi:hypothetical protein
VQIFQIAVVVVVVERSSCYLLIGEVRGNVVAERTLCCCDMMSVCLSYHWRIETWHLCDALDYDNDFVVDVDSVVGTVVDC